MSLACVLLNNLCRLLYQREYRKFTSPCNVGQVQEAYLMELLRRNADTVYGRKCGFSKISSYAEFTESVPLTVYEDYEPYINSIAKGQKHVLTQEPVQLFELTSGSSGGKKYIPYTRSLKQEFQCGIKPWLCDIYTHVQGVNTGKSYWSITPVTAGKSYTESGIPVGFEEDAEYFGAIEKRIMQRLFAVDSSVKFSSDTETFYRDTALSLLNCPELSLISVWNPTFLTILSDFIRAHAEQLAAQLPSDRAALLREAASENRFDRLFPNLKMISCWADGSAADYVDAVSQRFPDVYLQPKGLLATECFVSFPLTGEDGSRLSIHSHFFEFRSMNDGQICTAAQLRKGEYEVIVTTGGGFYRYRIGDIIKVLKTYPDHPPRIRFLRRNGISSDLFGEKLTEDFVRSVCRRLGIEGHFCLLAPEGRRYCLYTTADGITDDALDTALCESYHYEYCRSLGQLERAAVIPVSGNPEHAYIARLSADGMRIGDIKPAVLSRKSGWGRWFTPDMERMDTPC